MTESKARTSSVENMPANEFAAIIELRDGDLDQITGGVRKAGEHPQEYLTITMTNTMISG